MDSTHLLGPGLVALVRPSQLLLGQDSHVSATCELARQVLGLRPSIGLKVDMKLQVFYKGTGLV